MDLINFEELGFLLDEKNQTWQNNQIEISKAINKLVRDNERLPTQIEIAKEAGVDRRTVYVHLKEFKRLKRMAEDLEQYEVMAPNVFGKLLELAMDGDTKAIRLWLFIMGFMDKKKAEE